MRVVEESYLKRNVAKLNIYALSHADYQSFYESVEKISIEPLQDLSFKTDLDYFEKINFTLGVIASIISRPRISTQTEEVIMRAELANTFSPDTFQRTLRDSKLWTEEGLEMTPQHVYCYQSTDELKIYENIFIVTLIDLIDAELKKYAEFYASLVQTFFGQEEMSMDSNAVNIAFAKMDVINRKLKHIKSTHFYQTIRKNCAPLKTVHPTNILLKERAYNLCFKFYRTLITYTDKQALMYDLQTYHLVLLLKALKKQGFALKENCSLGVNANGQFRIKTLQFTSKQFDVTLSPYQEEQGFTLTILHHFAETGSLNQASHLLLLSSAASFSDVSPADLDKLPFTSKSAISLWNVAHITYNAVTPVFDNVFSEQELADFYLQARLSHAKADVQLYSSFCPVCKSRSVQLEEGRFLCSDCKSEYVFYSDEKQKDCIWFLNLKGAINVPLASKHPEARMRLVPKNKEAGLWKIQPPKP